MRGILNEYSISLHASIGELLSMRSECTADDAEETNKGMCVANERDSSGSHPILKLIFILQNLNWLGMGWFKMLDLIREVSMSNIKLLLSNIYKNPRLLLK